VYLGLCENPGVWGANPASKEKVSPASSVVISPNCEVCHGSRGSLAALWAVAVECPYASARAVPAARPLSARTPRDARTTRGCAGCCSAECAARGDGVLQDQAGAGRQLVRGAARGGFKVGDLLRLAADRCSLEYHSSSVHTEASCCAAACSPRRARALQASSRGEEAAEISVQHVADRGWQAHSSCTVRAGT